MPATNRPDRTFRNYGANATNRKRCGADRIWPKRSQWSSSAMRQEQSLGSV